ncbi:MAG: cysteine desulfurase [Erysipelotrichaceae bacterium]|nr:cysteine desulfurase [Erysipelotrichaceae bacterium]
MIYFDYASTSFVESEVLESYSKFLKDNFANADSLHHLGVISSNYLSKAREQVASFFGVGEDEVIFTSGASESNNLALKGVAFKYASRGKKIITTRLEHSSVSKTLEQLEQHFGYIIEYVDVDENGKVDLKQLERLIDNQTILVSICAIVSETGHRLNVEQVGEFLKKYPKVFFHVDATQLIGKYQINIGNIDLLSFSAHKFYSLKGVGALIKKHNVDLIPLICGGEQEDGLRGGTSNVPSIMMMSKSLRLAYENMKKREKYVASLYDYLYEKLSLINGVTINSSKEGSCYILNFSVLDYRNEVLLNEFSKKEIYLSSKSACSSKDKGLSKIVNYLYKDERRAMSSLRVSFSYRNTKEEIDIFVQELMDIMKRIKRVK